MPQPQPQPTPAERVTRALQIAHDRAAWDHERARQELADATERHGRALASVAHHRREEHALAAALADRGVPTMAEERQRQAEAEHARRAAVLAAPLPSGFTPAPVPGPVIAGTAAAVATIAAREV